MVKAWIAREWRNGKTDGAASVEGSSSAAAEQALAGGPQGAWSASEWDENMLAMCECLSRPRAAWPSLRPTLTPLRLLRAQSRPTSASASPARTSTRRT